MEAVLKTPELVNSILVQVNDKDLYSARLVNRSWCSEATGVLFRHCSVEKLEVLQRLKTHGSSDYGPCVWSASIHDGEVSSISFSKADVLTYIKDCDSAAEQVLSTAELLDIILEYSTETEYEMYWMDVQLADARLVNKLWYQRASKLFFSKCSFDKLDQLLDWKRVTKNDYSSFVKSISVPTIPNASWKPYSNLDLVNVTHLETPVYSNIGAPEFLSIYETCPGINRIHLSGWASALADFLPSCIAADPDFLLDMEILEGNSTDGSDLERVLTWLDDSLVSTMYFTFSIFGSKRGELAIVFLDTLIKFPALVPCVSGLTLVLGPEMINKLARWDHLGELFRHLKNLHLDAIDWERDSSPTLDRSLLRLVECAKGIDTLHLTIGVPRVEDDWIEKLTDRMPAVRYLRLVTHSNEPLSGMRLFRNFKKCRNLQELVISCCTFNSSGPWDLVHETAVGLEISEFDDTPEVWFPCLRTLDIYSNVDEAVFQRLVLHHMPQLSCLVIRDPTPEYVVSYI